MIAGTHVPQTSAPDKRVYEITGEGRDVLTEWAESPTLPADRSKKNGLLLKVFMTRHARPEALEPLLAGYRASVEQQLADLQAIVDQLTGRHRARFGRLTARWGVPHAQASLAWLAEAEAFVASQHDAEPDVHPAPGGRRNDPQPAAETAIGDQLGVSRQAAQQRSRRASAHESTKPATRAH